MTIVERLQELPNPRRGAGQRHPLVPMTPLSLNKGILRISELFCFTEGAFYKIKNYSKYKKY